MFADRRSLARLLWETSKGVVDRESHRAPPWGDADSGRRVLELRSDGERRRRAVVELHTLLVRMAYTSLRSSYPALRRDDLEEVALEAADEAAVRVLAHLDDFRGASRFTTWACRFAVREAEVAMRRRRRHQREVPVEPSVLVDLAGSGTSVVREHEGAELLRVVCEGMADALSPRQREVLLALVVDGRSPEEVAALLETTTGALYKCVYDARGKLRGYLERNGLTPGGELSVVV